jgi:hypothetical protein
MAEAAGVAGTSQRQGYRSGGALTLGNRSSAPCRCKHRIGGERSTEIISGPAIVRQLGMPVSAVSAILRRLGLGKLKALVAKPPIARYERQRPSELIHIDSKKLGRIGGIGYHDTSRTAGTVNGHPGIGWRQPRLPRDHAGRTQGERSGLSRAGAQLTGARRCHRRTGDDRQRLGLYRVAVAATGLKHERTCQYSPRTNGKPERLIPTSLREWAHARPYATLQQRGAALRGCLEYYNTVATRRLGRSPAGHAIASIPFPLSERVRIGFVPTRFHPRKGGTLA